MIETRKTTERDRNDEGEMATLNELAYVDRGSVEGYFAGLDLGEVENVAHNVM